MSFQPGQPPRGLFSPEVSSVWNYLQNLERRILSGFNFSFISLPYLTAEPARPSAGMVVLADGVNWDPGSGEGMYRRNLANSAWVFLG